MKAVIFAGGNISDKYKVRKYLQDSSIVICADSGIEHCFDLGIVPDLLVGDMDSASPTAMKKAKELGIKQHSFPSEKDYTDTELAIEAALNHGAKEAVLLGAIGNRPDHSLANIFLLVHFRKRGMNLKIADGNWEMFLIDGTVTVDGKEGDVISLIPITPEVVGVKTFGLYYPLKDETLFLGPARGISNVYVSKTAKVQVKQGILLAVKYDKVV